MAAKNSPSETAVLADDESDIIEDLDAAIAELDPDNQVSTTERAMIPPLARLIINTAR